MVKKSKSKTKSSKKVSKRKISKKSTKRKSTRKNPESWYVSARNKHDKEELERFERFYPGKLTISKLKQLKEDAYEIDQLYRKGKKKEWEKEEVKFVEKNGRLGNILLENAQAMSDRYA